MHDNALTKMFLDLCEELGVGRPRDEGKILLGEIQRVADESGQTLGAVLKQLHAKASAPISPTPTRQDCYRPQVPLPPGLTVDKLKLALDYTQELVAMINYEIAENTGKPLTSFI